MYLKKLILVITCMLLSFNSCYASESVQQPSVAVAVFVNHNESNSWSSEMLNKAINEVVRIKLATLFLNNTICSGSTVISEMNRYGINSNQITSSDLFNYGKNNNLNYIIVISVLSKDVALNIKVFSVPQTTYLIDKSIDIQDGWNSQEDLNVYQVSIVIKKLTIILETELDDILKLIN